MTKAARNQFMECCKLLAAIFVVFIHVRFPGAMGDLADCAARFAVPMFFAISGYFSFQTRGEKLNRRIKHILRLNIGATLLYIVWCSFRTVFIEGGTLADYFAKYISLHKLSTWVVLSVNPFQSHLWYLTAILECYLALWLYVRLQSDDRPVSYRAFYIIGTCLLVFNLAFGSFASASDMSVSFLLCRNALFFGLPMFSMGMFIREHQERIFSRFPITDKKLVAFILGGLVFSVLEWMGGRNIELSVGTLCEVFALMLLLVSHPVIFRAGSAGEKLVSHLGPLSTYIYITHLLWNSVYSIFISPQIAAIAGGRIEAWLCPLMVAGLSLVTGVIWRAIVSIAGKKPV